jgi:hypothetical protein
MAALLHDHAGRGAQAAAAAQADRLHRHDLARAPAAANDAAANAQAFHQPGDLAGKALGFLLDADAAELADLDQDLPPRVVVARLFEIGGDYSGAVVLLEELVGEIGVCPSEPSGARASEETAE